MSHESVLICVAYFARADFGQLVPKSNGANHLDDIGSQQRLKKDKKVNLKPETFSLNARCRLKNHLRSRRSSVVVARFCISGSGLWFIGLKHHEGI